MQIVVIIHSETQCMNVVFFLLFPFSDCVLSLQVNLFIFLCALFHCS